MNKYSSNYRILKLKGTKLLNKLFSNFFFYKNRIIKGRDFLLKQKVQVIF